MLVTLGLFGVLTLIAVQQLKDLDVAIVNASAELQGFFKQVRARAISTTSAYTVTPISSTEISTSYSTSCTSETTTADPQMVVELPLGAYLRSTDWSICYSPRGLPDDNIQIEVYDDDGVTKTVEVYLGGAVREVS